ncbi:hypothetical protein BU25DRAFT_469565 [Macroventuria anomochaeta]|uniref:Uncharacterized protein n=1 Tax=Macroventuria anomochaeta TaxID=301207 RepID=A0ACB6S0U9_9PLEO|nr:uncharacterized protein BU25DRAFT_469565 [Macroventuria anomochaeta]KAF2627132.1 hypothetical protein BU25DRAFT_469565 [Macroventuria anomochaeta]
MTLESYQTITKLEEDVSNITKKLDDTKNELDTVTTRNAELSVTSNKNVNKTSQLEVMRQEKEELPSKVKIGNSSLVDERNQKQSEIEELEADAARRQKQEPDLKESTDLAGQKINKSREPTGYLQGFENDFDRSNPGLERSSQHLHYQDPVDLEPLPTFTPVEDSLNADATEFKPGSKTLHSPQASAITSNPTAEPESIRPEPQATVKIRQPLTSREARQTWRRGRQRRSKQTHHLGINRMISSPPL